MSLISKKDYDQIERWAAVRRRGLMLILAVPGLVLIAYGLQQWLTGQSDWRKGLYSATFTELMTGIGLIVWPWRYLQVLHRRIRREPMLEKQVEFRFDSDHFSFIDGEDAKDIPWRDVRSTRFARSTLLILLRNNVLYYVNTKGATIGDRNYIRASFQANRPKRGRINIPFSVY